MEFAASQPGAVAVALLVLSACGGADAARADGNPSLEAVLSIERLEDAGHTDAPSASAMAQFVILPSDVDVHDTLGAAGLRSQLPERLGCVDLTAADAPSREPAASNARRSSAARSSAALRYSLREPLELLEAGEVSIRAGDMLTRLALNAFPPSGSASGVIYTTPDQSAEPLPPDENYAIHATGSRTIPPLSIAGRAPGSLGDITLGGVPLEHAQQLVAGQPLDITWAEGAAGDRVYVELADTEHSFACAFPDDDGSGSVPGALTAQLHGSASNAGAGSASDEGSVRLSLHRVREALQAEIALEDGRAENLADISSLETTVRFDFETTAVLRVQ
jgi:hypothetical protein